VGLIIQGNCTGMLALHVGDQNLCFASGNAHLPSLMIQGADDPELVTSVAQHPASWELFRRSASSEVLGLYLEATTDEVDRMKSQTEFGAVKVVDSLEPDHPWSLEVILVLDDSKVEAITELLRTALLDRHLHYGFAVQFPAFEKKASEGMPTLKQFKEGSVVRIESASFTLKYENNP
jgi:hypothetical protein